MKKTILAALILAAGAMGERNPEIHESMEATDKAVVLLRKLEKKTGPEAVRAAEQIAVTYEDMLPFWRGRNSAAAVKTSQAGKNLAVQLAAAAAAGDATTADATFKELMGTCKTCHDVHRERGADGRFRTK